MRCDCRYGPTSPPASGPSSQSRPSHRIESSSFAYDSSESRAASVSSMRNTNIPPTCRAYAQLNNAVRTSPTCGFPVGDGLKRTRTGPAWSVTRYHPVGQRTDVLDGHRHLVTRLHRPHPGGSAGEQYVAGEQGHEARDVRHEGRDVEDQVRRTRVLTELAVDPGLDLEVVGFEVGLDPRAQRAERVETLGPRPLAVANLQIARRHVVADGVAVDHLVDVVGVDVAADPADDHGELALVVQAV